MKVICTNIGPAELGGQLEWEGSAADYSQQVEARIKTAFVEGKPVNREDHGHVFVTEITDQDRRDLASAKILKFYPLWKQANIVRENDTVEVSKMSAFINYCRNWSNDSNNVDPFGLENITPENVD
jgi:hypothetical protein